MNSFEGTLRYQGFSTATEGIKARISDELNKKINIELEEQLGELIKRGLLIIQQLRPTLIDMGNNKYEIKTAVKLVLKDQEYIEKLEKDLKDLKDSYISLLNKYESKNHRSLHE